MTIRELMSSRDARVYLTGQSFSLFGDTSMFLALGFLDEGIGSLFFEGGSLAMVLVGALIFGIALPPLPVGAYTLLQLHTPADLQGRFSAFDLIAPLPQTISIAVGSALIFGDRAKSGATGVGHGKFNDAPNGVPNRGSGLIKIRG